MFPQLHKVASGSKYTLQLKRKMEIHSNVPLWNFFSFFLWSDIGICLTFLLPSTDHQRGSVPSAGEDQDHRLHVHGGFRSQRFHVRQGRALAHPRHGRLRHADDGPDEIHQRTLLQQLQNENRSVKEHAAAMFIQHVTLAGERYIHGEYARHQKISRFS